MFPPKMTEKLLTGTLYKKNNKTTCQDWSIIEKYHVNLNTTSFWTDGSGQKVKTLTVCISIMITSPCNVYSLTPHFYIVKIGFTGVYIIFIFLL